MNIDINDVITLISATEIAINKKVFTKEEITKIFPSWNNLAATLEKHKRQLLVDKLYSEEQTVPIAHPINTSASIQEKVGTFVQ
jgi:hypothetical protein